MPFGFRYINGIKCAIIFRDTIRVLNSVLERIYLFWNQFCQVIV